MAVLTGFSCLGMFLEILVEELLAARAGIDSLPLSPGTPHTPAASIIACTFEGAAGNVSAGSSVASVLVSATSSPPRRPALSQTADSFQIARGRHDPTQHLADLNVSEDYDVILADLPDSSLAPAQRASFLSNPTPSRLPTSEPNSEASSVGPASSDSDETSTEEDEEGDVEEDGGSSMMSEVEDQLTTPRRPRVPAGPSATPLRSALKRGRTWNGLRNGSPGGGGGRIGRVLEGRSVSFSLVE